MDFLLALLPPPGPSGPKKKNLSGSMYSEELGDLLDLVDLPLGAEIIK